MFDYIDAYLCNTILETHKDPNLQTIEGGGSQGL